MSREDYTVFISHLLFHRPEGWRLWQFYITEQNYACKVIISSSSIKLDLIVSAVMPLSRLLILQEITVPSFTTVWLLWVIPANVCHYIWQMTEAQTALQFFQHEFQFSLCVTQQENTNKTLERHKCSAFFNKKCFNHDQHHAYLEYHISVGWVLLRTIHLHRRCTGNDMLL